MESKSYPCKRCGKPFSKRLSTDRFCSAKCAGSSGLKRTPIKKKVSKKNKEFDKIKKLIKGEVISEEGYISCQYCGINNSYIWETHHILYRSEVPNHEFLNHPKNLIILCSECHRWFHENKDNREWLIEKRGLRELFGLKSERYSKK